MQSWITSPQVTELLNALYEDAAISDPQARKEHEESNKQHEPGLNYYKRMRKAYMAVGPEFGQLLYSLARATRARTVVEFGTSFGVSAIYLASAIRDNGGGKLIATEFDEEKAARAKENLTIAGVVDLVEFRVGDAVETLARPVGEIDMIFLDGAKELYLPVLQLLEPCLRSGGIVACDNTDQEGTKAAVEYLRNPSNGYTTSAIFTEGGNGKAHEISVKN